MRGVFDERELEPVSARRDTELTLGSGTLLAIFFGLVLLCGLCFGLGYAMGHRGAQSSVDSTPGANTPQPLASSSTIKPSAAAQPATAPVADSGTTIDASQPQALPIGTVPVAASQTAPAYSNSSQPAGGGQAQVHPALTAGTAIAPAMQSNPNGVVHPALGSAGSFMVQIAAVSDQEDADVLTTALRRRGYAVTEQHEPIDNLIHVRIGPFATVAEANNWKTRLLNYGYNAIVQQ